MSDLVICPKCESDQVVELGIKPPKPFEDITLTREKEDELLTDLFGHDNWDRQCLVCGNKWNAEEEDLRQQEDQSQLNALTFGDRKDKFYADYESGQLDQASQNVPVEALGIYRRKGLKAAYRFLKLLDIKVNRFKKRTTLAVLGVVLLLVLIYVFV
jgi:predicted nucleic-acid-binding Zn-ribbon protein